MDIQFQGFNPVFSSFLLVILIFAVLLLSWWSYSYLKSLPPGRRMILVFLRAAALLLLVTLLFNPYLELEETESHLPRIAVYLDDSQSMRMQRGEYEGRDTYLSILERFNISEMNNADVQLYRFGSDVGRIGDSYLNLDLAGSVTNIDDVIRHAHDQSGEVVAAVIFSDGIVTRGQDPRFNAESLDIPLFTVPVGDTARIRDIAVSEVSTRETGYVDSRQTVQATVSQEGFQDGQSTVQLIRGDEVIDEQQIEFDSGNTSHRVEFELEFEQEGIRNYEVYTPGVEGEMTTENNTYPFSVNVVDDRVTVYHAAFEIHPDVKAIRSILESDRKYELQPYTWTGNGYIEHDTFDADIDDIDLFIIHGSIPGNSGLPVEELAQLPAIQFATPGSSVGNTVSSAIPVEMSNAGSVLGVRMQLHEPNRNHPVLEFRPAEPDRMPPLSFRQADYELPVTAEVLYTAQFGRNATDMPVIFVEEAGNIRRAVVNAYGWFTYTLSAESPPRDFSTDLIANLVAWTSTSPDAEHLRMGPDRQIYTEGEEILFRADLTRETGDPETDAVIEVEITGEEGEERVYSMRHQNSGSYQLPVRSVTAGNYGYRAEARKSGRIIDQAEGEFSVTASTQEYLNTERNDELLRNLADITGGRFLDEHDPAILSTELQNRGLLEQIEEQNTTFRFLHQHVTWFILVMILLGAEWLLRRRYALP